MIHASCSIKPAFGLLETIITLAISSLLAVAIGSFIVSSYKTSRFAEEQREAIVSARRGIDTMVQEIRSARAGEDGSYPVQAAEDFSFTFFGDIDGDARVEKVRYWLEGSDLKKGVIKPSGTPVAYPVNTETVRALSPYVHNGAAPIFRYYNGDYPGDVINNPLPTPTRLVQTKLMHVFLEINVDASRAPNSFVLESLTQLRNLKTNL